MKKNISIALAAVAFGCLSISGNHVTAASSGKLEIVTTIFPEYDWVKEILGEYGEDVELTMLLDNGVDLHSYQPTAEDILKISNCDLFIYVGGESDEWVENVLKDAVNQNMRVIDLMDVMGDAAKEEESVEGMQEADHDHEEEEAELDEHVWLSLKNAEILCGAIADELAEIDPEHGSAYQENVAAYTEKLAELDGRYQEAAKAGTQDTLLFADRFPFRYLVDDYGISYYAAFAGCSAESEASFETITFLAGKVDELGLGCVLTIDGSEQKIANTVVENTGSGDQKILTLDSMQSATSQDVADGATYLSIMENNLKILKEALK